MTQTQKSDILSPPPYTFSINQTFDAADFGWRTFDAHYLLYASAGLFHLEVGERRWLLPPQRAAWIRADTSVRIVINESVTCSSVLFATGTIKPPSFDCRVFTVSSLAREMLIYAGRWGRGRDPDNREANTFFASLADVCTELALVPSELWLPRADSAELAAALTYRQSGRLRQRKRIQPQISSIFWRDAVRSSSTAISALVGAFPATA